MITLAEGRKSPFFGVEIGIEAKAPDFLPAFLQSLSLPPSSDAKHEMGKLLCSAVAHGALLDRHLWDAWVVEVPSYRPRGSLSWFEMVIKDATSPTGKATRRWFGDPITNSLINRWREHFQVQERRVRCGADECIRHFLANLMPGDEDHGSSSGDLLRWATMHWRLRMPALLVDQACGSLPTISLSSYDFLRLYGVDHAIAKRMAARVRQPANPHKDWRQPVRDATRAWMHNFRGGKAEDSYALECYAFDEVMRLWRNGSLGHGQLKRQAIAYLEIAATTHCQNKARVRLIEWCQSLLELDRRPYKQGLAPYTVRLRLVSLLEGVLSGVRPKTLDEISRKQVLLKARDAAAQENCKTRRQLILRAALDFSQFEKGYSPQELDPEEEERDIELDAEDQETEEIQRETENLSEGRGATSVSANLLSSTDYLNAIEWAYKADDSDELALIIMLGFRTGLRLREILGLQTCDILARGDLLEIHLKPNSFRDLKTFRSRRIIPLNLFLTFNERNSLRNWLVPRNARARQSKSPLLVFGPIGATSMPDELAYGRMIATILRKACRKKFSFSHLRHSFSSFLLLNLLMPSPDSERLIPFHFRNLVTWDRKWRLQSSLMGKDRLGQSALHAVSQMMGHTGILRTLESYQHLLDLAVGLYVNRQITLPYLPPETFAELNLTPRAHTKVPEVLGPTDYWHRVAKKLCQLPALTSDCRAVQASADTNARPGNWRYSRIRVRRPGKAKSDSSSKIGWRLLHELLTRSEEESLAKAAELGIDIEPLKRRRARYSQVIGSAFAPGALPDGLTRPRGQQADQVAEKIWSRLPDYLTDEEYRLLQHFLNNFRSARYHGVFDSLEDAVAFASFLRKIGFPGDHIGIAAGPANLIQSYKLDPTLLGPEDVEGVTLYRRPDDLRDMAGPKNGAGERKNPVVLWFRYMKFERDGLGDNFDTRYRLDFYQKRQDDKHKNSELCERRKRAADNRNKRLAKADDRKKHLAEGEDTFRSTIFAAGNKAYRFSLLLAAIYHDVELNVQFPEPSKTGRIPSRERRLAKERASEETASNS